jgi:hypothetical protein
MTTQAVVRAGVLAGAIALLAACNASAPSSPGGGGTSSARPAGQTATAQPPGGGVDVQDPCALATIEEVSAALGTEVVEAEAVTGDTTTYCNYKTADGSLALATSFGRGQTFVFDSFKNADDAIPVPGVGDDAVISTGTLFIKQGDAVVGIQPSSSIGSAEDLVEALTSLAQIIAGRL